jgi:sec-independent protein translocase protein TatA
MFGGRLGWSEILIILLVLVVIFGPKKLPQLGKSIGEGLREFKKSVKTDDRTDDAKKQDPDTKA